MCTAAQIALVALRFFGLREPDDRLFGARSVALDGELTGHVQAPAAKVGHAAGVHMQVSDETKMNDPQEPFDGTINIFEEAAKELLKEPKNQAVKMKVAKTTLKVATVTKRQWLKTHLQKSRNH